jgi:hypothetical protein
MKLEKLIKIKLWWIKFEKKPLKNAKKKKAHTLGLVRPVRLDLRKDQECGPGVAYTTRPLYFIYLRGG